MAKSQVPVESLDNGKLSISRRSFIKGVAAASATAALYGCSSGSSDTVYVPVSSGDGALYSEDIDSYLTEKPTFRWGTTSHNCGGRCITKAEVTSDGRIARFLTDDTKIAWDGSTINNDSRNTTQSRACSRCRAYKGRLYHPGRLKYPLKQMKKRGDVTGFVRISWKQAYDEIVERLKAVQNSYGPEAMHVIYACGNISSPFQSASYEGVFAADDWIAPAIRLIGGATGYTSDYSFHQCSYIGGWYGTAYSGYNLGSECISPSADDIAGIGKNVILWGSNIPTTHNHLAFSWVKGVEDMKKRDPESKVLFIGPEFSEAGIAIADEWIRSRPYTDNALIIGMLGEMIKGTFNTDGSLVAASSRMLDVDYLDTMVYGFFDSPEYWLHNKKYSNGSSTHIGSIDDSDRGKIYMTKPTAIINDWILEQGVYYVNPINGDVQTGGTAPDGWDTLTSRWQNVSNTSLYSYVEPILTVAAVPAGKSLSAYIMGSDDRLTKAAYGSSNYVAAQFTTKGAGYKRNQGTVSYNAPASSKFGHKKDMSKVKDADWASAITGIPAAKIRELAALYVKAGKNGEQIWNEWSGGQLKQADGVYTLYALQTLMIVTNNWGRTATGVMNSGMTPKFTIDPKEIKVDDLKPASWGSVQAMRTSAMPSVTQWHSGVKFAFKAQLEANGYVANIPNYKTDTMNAIVYSDDGGIKALVRRAGDISTPINTFTTPEGATYYEYAGHTGNTVANGEATVSGFRFILNTGGNIPVNQHANSIDSARMFEALPTYGYTNTALNVAIDKAFYMVTFDNFMSPSARYSDYVLPAKTSWEQENVMVINNGAAETLYIDDVIQGPGESKSTWDFARDLIKAYGGADEAVKFTGKNSDTTFKEVVEDYYLGTASQDPASPYYEKTWDEFLAKPFSTPFPSRSQTTEITLTATRAALNTYLTSAGIASTPFYADIETVDTTNGFGFGWNEFAKPEDCPQQSKRFHVYSGSLVWKFEHLFDKWHGHLPLAQQGQKNDDGEGDPTVYPIIMYFDYKDYFRQAYGLTDNTALEGRYLMTTTHDRFRAHSSQSENPYLRELTHRVIGGELYSGNDAGDYAISSNPNTDDSKFTPINSLIGADGKPVAGKAGEASYADIWVNTDDFASYNDGDLVKVENEIGIVYCTIRKTNRCIPGYVGLHQGCWFDPRTIDGKTVDVGGCCNTLMASKPSRADHGNAQQSAMVKITKVS